MRPSLLHRVLERTKQMHEEQLIATKHLTIKEEDVHEHTMSQGEALV